MFIFVCWRADGESFSDMLILKCLYHSCHLPDSEHNTHTHSHIYTCVVCLQSDIWCSALRRHTHTLGMFTQTHIHTNTHAVPSLSLCPVYRSRRRQGQSLRMLSLSLPLSLFLSLCTISLYISTIDSVCVVNGKSLYHIILS